MKIGRKSSPLQVQALTAFPLSVLPQAPSTKTSFAAASVTQLAPSEGNRSGSQPKHGRLLDCVPRLPVPPPHRCGSDRTSEEPVTQGVEDEVR